MRVRGFSMVELMTVLVIAGIAMAIAVPQLQSQIVSARSRAVAESIQSGLLLARSEAIKRNGLMRFQLISAMVAACAPSATSRLWVVTQFTGANTRGEPWGLCDKAAYAPPDQEEPCPVTPAYSGSAASCAADPFIAYKSGTEDATHVAVAAAPATTGALAGFLVTFGPLGQLAANFDGAATPAGTAATIDVAPSAGIEGRRYRIQINTNGNVRLCNPDAVAPDAMTC